jgi:deazaflavin-dependent oxidoreductase (nitroreductase family)
MASAQTWKMRVLTGAHRAVFDVTRGRVLGSMVGMPVFKVTTTGHRSGEPRVTMLTAPIVESGRVVLVASYGGSPTHPHWYRNMLADPRVVLVGGGRKRVMTARTATRDERDLLWPRVVATYAGYAAYQAKTPREIPLVICE